MTDLARVNDMFGSLHGDIDNPFSREDLRMNNDEAELPFEPDILDDLISKNEDELPVDIRTIQPSPLESPSSQNPCDVIHHLHGDQQRQEKQPDMQKSPHCVTGMNTDLNNSPYARQKANGYHLHSPQTEEYLNNQQMYNPNCSPQQQHPQDQYNISCLPDSPPDSGSEAHSPTQMGRSPQDQYMQRLPGYSQQGAAPYNTSSPYERTPPDSYPPRMHNPAMGEYNVAPNDPHCSTMNDVGGMYGDGGYNRQEHHRMMSSLSPGSCISDTSHHSNHGINYIVAPATKKRKHSDHHQAMGHIPQQLNAAALLNQQYKGMIQQPVIKQEPGPMGSPRNGMSCRPGYYNEAFDLTDDHPGPQGPGPQHPATISGSARLGEPHQQDGVLPNNRTPPLGGAMIPPHYGDNMAYQVIKWRPFLQDTWHPVYDRTRKELQTVSYRVDADKGFNFAVADDAFVCQKKNHFQVTVHIGVIGHPQYIKTEDGIKPLEAFHLNLYGVKHESQNQTIAIEQSQSDRSKKPFHPVKVDLPGDQVTKVTIGRLHFSETTTNNMRKKGRPNPDQRYFMCIVALHGQAGGKSYTIAAAGTDKIIVRASNPGQFDQDDVQWLRAQIPDAIYHHGRVGINYDHPDEALVVHGNVKVTGHIMNPSDRRAKHAIKEVDTSTQLKNVQNIRLCHYRYSPEYATYAGIDTNREETGVIAQEFAEVLPEAVKNTGEVRLPNGEVIPNFLVVDKDRLYMENVGAVKELCKLTGNFEERIDELERWNKKLSKLKMYDSFRSNASAMSGYSNGSSITSVSRQGSTRYPVHKKPPSSGQKHRSQRNRKSVPPPTTCWSNRAVLWSIIALVIVMALSVISMPIIYGMGKSGKSGNSGSDSVEDTPSPNTTLSTLLTAITTSSNSKSTTTHTSFGHAQPIIYCPHDMSNDGCPGDKEYCCSHNGGSPLFIPCPRSVAIDVAHSVFVNRTGTIVRYGSKHMPSVNIPAFETGWNKHKFFDSPRKGIYVYDGDDIRHPSMHKTSNKGTDASTYRKTNSKNVHLNVAKSSGSYDTRIDQNYDINPGTINGYRRPRRDVTDHKTIAAVRQILLVEPNVTLYQNQSADIEEDDSPYLMCDGGKKNFTFDIPVSSMSPPNTAIHIRFDLESTATVVLCSVPDLTTSSCPHEEAIANEYRPPRAVTEKNADFAVYYSSFASGSYKFRVSTSEAEPLEICNAITKFAGDMYIEFLLHFYRVCDSEDSSTDHNNETI